MKKIFVLGVVIIICLISIAVYAAGSYNTELVGPKSVNAGSEFEVIIKLKDLTDINGTANGITVVTLTMNFDESKLEKKEITGLNGFIITEGTNLVIDKAEGVSTDTEIVKIKFKVKDTVTAGNTSIELTNISSSNGSIDIASNDVSMIISINNNSNNTDDNNGNQNNNNTNNNTNTDNNNGNQNNTNTDNQNGTKNNTIDNKGNNTNTNGNNNNSNNENIAKGLLPDTGTNIANYIIFLLVAILSRSCNIFIC
jgi:hypothetical protein